MTNWSDWKIKKAQRELFEYFDRRDIVYDLVEPFIVTRKNPTTMAPKGSMGLVVAITNREFGTKWAVLLENGDSYKMSSPDKWEINKENEMENVNYIGGEYNVVAVEYINDRGNKWFFKADVSLNLGTNDLVVVESRNGYGICKVISKFENNLENAAIVNKATAWVVDKVDTTNQDKRKEATKRREYLVKQLEEKKQQFQVTQMYELMAKVDPEAAKLLDELKLLN